MAKLMMLFIKIILIGLVFFLALNSPNYYRSLMVGFEKVPQEFERYQFLDQLVSNSNFNIKPFTSIYPEYPFRINDSLICIPNHSGDIHSNEVETSAYYKVNAFGEVVDSLTLINEPIIAQGNYLINKEKEYYLTWLIDGDTSQKEFSLIENGKFIEESQFADYTDSAEFTDYLYAEDSITNKQFVKIFYFKDRNWNKVYTEERFLVDTKCFVENSLEFKEIEQVATLNFFHKKEWYGHYYPDFGFYINGKPTEHWKGVGYYNVGANNKKVVFKRGNLKLSQDYSVNTSTQLLFYENPTRKYLLISRQNDSSQGSDQFLIQYK